MNLSFDLMLTIWASVAVASVLRAFTGFGFALAAVPIFIWVLPPSLAVVLSASLVFATSSLRFGAFKKALPKRKITGLLVTLIVFSSVGVVFLSSLERAKFQLLAGVILLIACLLLVFSRRFSFSGSTFKDLFTGSAAGLLNGLLSMPGPPLILYVLATEKDPAQSRALLMTLLLVSAALALVNFTWMGFVTIDSLWLFLLAWPVMLLGDRLGNHWFASYGSQQYRRVAIGVLVLIALSSVASGVGQL